MIIHEDELPMIVNRYARRHKLKPEKVADSWTMLEKAVEEWQKAHGAPYPDKYLAQPKQTRRVTERRRKKS